MQSKYWFLSVAFVSACSGGTQIFDDAGGVDATADVTKPQEDGSTKDVTSGGDTSTTSDASDAGVDAPNPDLPCLTDDAGCVSCCFNNHPDGAVTYFGTLETCACTTGATCHSASVCLNNLCKGSNPSPTCDNCLSNPDAGDCYNKADNACAGDPDCVALFDCALDLCSPPVVDASAD